MNGAVLEGDHVCTATHRDRRVAFGQVYLTNKLSSYGVDAGDVSAIDADVDHLAVRPNGRACQQLVRNVVRADRQRDILLYVRNDILVFAIGILCASQQFRYTVYCTVRAYGQRLGT